MKKGKDRPRYEEVGIEEERNKYVISGTQIVFIHDAIFFDTQILGSMSLYLESK